MTIASQEFQTEAKLKHTADHRYENINIYVGLEGSFCFACLKPHEAISSYEQFSFTLPENPPFSFTCCRGEEGVCEGHQANKYTNKRTNSSSVIDRFSSDGRPSTAFIQTDVHSDVRPKKRDRCLTKNFFVYSYIYLFDWWAVRAG